jgi:ABC-type transporter Mla MlaB component
MADFAIRGPIARADLPGLCDRVCKLLAAAGDVVTCDVAGVEPDAVTVEAIARLQLAALRRGCRVELVNASSELSGLVDFLGLRDVLSPAAGAARRAGRSSPWPGRT